MDHHVETTPNIDLLDARIERMTNIDHETVEALRLEVAKDELGSSSLMSSNAVDRSAAPLPCYIQLVDQVQMHKPLEALDATPLA